MSPAAPASPERHTDLSGPINSTERPLYSLEGFEEWRARQHGVLHGLREASLGDVSNTEYIDIFVDSIDTTLEEYLREKGVDESSANYDEIKTLYRNNSIDRIRDDEWYTSPASRGEHGTTDTKSGRDKANALVQERLRDSAATPEDESERREHGQLSQEEIDHLKEKQKEIFEKYAKMIAERSKHLIEGSTTREEINRLKDEASHLVAGFATMMMDELLEAKGIDVANLSDDEKIPQDVVDAIDVFVNAQADGLIGQMEDYRLETHEQKGGWLKRLGVIDVWAKWTDESTEKATGKRKFFSKGNAKKLLATTGFAAGAGAIAAYTLPLAAITASIASVSAVGLGLATGAGMAFRSIGRNLATGHIDRKAAEKKLATVQSEEMRAQYARVIAESEAKQRRTIFEVLDERSEIYRRRNLSRTLGGAAVAGAAGVLGSTFASILLDKIDIDDVVDGARGMVDGVKRWFGPVNGGEQTPILDDQHRPSLSDQKWDIPEADIQAGSDANGVTVDDRLEDLSEEAQTISRGEGMYKTFKDHGISKDHWSDLMKEVGPKLDEEYPKLVYKEGGEWRLGYAGDMPKGASEIILETADKHGWLDTAHESLLEKELPSVDKGEGLNEFVAENYDHTLTSQESLEVGERLNEQGFMYESDHLQDAYGNPYGINEAGHIDAQTDATIRDVIDDGKLNDSYTPEMVDDDFVIKDADLEGLDRAPDNTDWIDVKRDTDAIVSYLRAGNVQAINLDRTLQDTLNLMSWDLSNMTFENSETPIMRFDTSVYRWVVNEVPQGSSVPQKAIEIMQGYLQSTYKLAA